MNIRLKVDGHRPTVTHKVGETDIETDAAPVEIRRAYNPFTVTTDDGVEYNIALRDCGLEIVRDDGTTVLSIKDSLRGLEDDARFAGSAEGLPSAGEEE